MHYLDANERLSEGSESSDGGSDISVDLTSDNGGDGGSASDGTAELSSGHEMEQPDEEDSADNDVCDFKHTFGQHFILQARQKGFV